VLALLFLAALICIPKLERAGRERLAVACAELQSRITRESGLRLSFGSLSPAVLRGVSLDSLEARDDRGRIILSARRVYLYYNIGALLSGKGNRVISELRLEGVRIDLDAEDLRLLSSLSNRLSGNKKSRLPDFAISGSDLSLELEDAVPGGLSAGLESFRLSGGGLNADADFKGRVRIHKVSGSGPLELPIAARGSLARDFSAGRLDLSLSASSSIFSLATQRFDFSFNAGGAELRKIADKAPLDADLRYDAATGILSASLDMEDFEPRTSFKAKNALTRLEPWLALPYTGSLSLSSPLNDFSRLRYDVELSAGLSASSMKGLRRAELKAKGDAQSANIAYARIEGEAGRAEYSGSLRFKDLAPDGLLSVHSSPASAIPLEASVRIFGLDGHYAAVSDSVSIGGVEIRDLVLDASVRPETVDFNLSLLLPETQGAKSQGPGTEQGKSVAGFDRFAGEAASEGGLPRLRLEGSLSLGAAPMLDLALSLDSADLAPLEPLLAHFTPQGLSGMLSNFRVDGELYFRSDFSRFSYSATNLLIVPRSSPGSYVLLSLSGNDKGLTLKRGEFSGGGYAASLSGSLDFSDPERMGFQASLLYNDTPYDFRGTVAGSDVFISGDYGLRASLRQRDGEYFFSLGAESLPLPLGDLRVLCSFDSNGYYASPEDFRLDLGSLRAEVLGSTFMPTFSCVGLLGPKEGSLSSILVKDTASELRGEAKFSYDLKAERPALAFHARLDGAGGESYGLDGNYGPSGIEGDYGLDARLALAASPLSRFTKGPVSGRLSGSAQAQGSLSDLGLSFTANLDNGLFEGEPLALHVSGSERGGRLQLSDCAAAYRGMSLERLGLSFDSHTAEASLSGDFRSASASSEAKAGGKAATEPPLAFSFAASGWSLAEAGDNKKSSLASLFSRYRVEGSALNFKYLDSVTVKWPFVLLLAPEGTSFTGGGAGEFSAEYRSDGSFSAIAQSPLPFSFKATGRSSGGQIEAKLSDLSIDLPPVMGLAGSLPLLVDRGKITGALSAQGAVSDPDFSGSLELSDFVCRVPSWLAASIGPVSCPILIDGKRISSSIPTLSAGDAKLSLDLSAVMDGWLPSDVEARLKTLSGSALDLNAQVLGIGLKGKTGADIVFALSPGAVDLSGKLMIERSDVVINPGLFASSRSPGSSAATPFGLDLAIGFGPGVRVYFPSKDLPILLGYADPASSLHVVIDRDTGDLSFKGAAVLRGGDVFYIQRDFYLKSGKIVFNETSDKFDPLVTIEAERHERKDTEQVLITLSADSQPISNLVPKISADDPSLTQAEIINLLGAGLLGASDTSSVDWKSAAIASTEFIPQLNVTKTFENKVREVFGLDVFFMQSQVVQRWLLDISETGSTATRSSLASYLDGTSLYVGKYLGDTVFVHASASVDKDPLVSMGLLRLDSEFGVDFDTPFGRLMWSVSPENPENLFISDQSLSLSWKLQL
jgi:translocation and assembly module TamB